MSLIHRKKSTIFNQQSNSQLSTTYQIHIKSILDAYKAKLALDQNSIATQKPQAL